MSAGIAVRQNIERHADLNPDHSAKQVMGGLGLGILICAAFGFFGAAVAAPGATAACFVALMAGLFLCDAGFKALLFVCSLGTQRQLGGLPGSDVVPVYTVLVPLFREAAVLPRLSAALGRLDYPPGRLDIKFVLEADDEETVAAARKAAPGLGAEIVLVPPLGPRTKPKALNVAMETARGAFVVIYDAEDVPEPDQLRRALAAFAEGGARLACVQARLQYYNSSQTILTRLFALEYGLWFRYLLAGLDRMHLPMPLGGTSNHLRADVLRAVGGWDPYNVTEDADLGIRLAERGWSVASLPSHTGEEASATVMPWMRQRTRWLKGYMQTWIVRMRRPLRCFRELGPAGFFTFQLFVGGRIASALAAPVLWALLTAWLLAPGAEPWLPQPVERMALVSLIAGNGVAIGLAMAAALGLRRPGLIPTAFLVPVYGLLASAAAYRALWQLIWAPHFWEKTEHGLTGDHPFDRSLRAEDPAR